MRKIRIGKRVGIRWRVTINGEKVNLEEKDLTLFVHIGCCKPIRLPHAIMDTNVVAASFAGTTQKFLGIYSLTLYQDYGKESQNVVDHCDAFELVPCTCDETNNDLSNIDVIVEDTDFLVGIDGLNAYEVAVRDKVTNAAGEVIQTKDDWYAWLREPATLGVKELYEHISAIEDAEKKRVEAEWLRCDAEEIRREHEKERIAAEEKRQAEYGTIHEEIETLRNEVKKLKELNYLILNIK